MIVHFGGLDVVFAALRSRCTRYSGTYRGRLTFKWRYLRLKRNAPDRLWYLSLPLFFDSTNFHAERLHKVFVEDFKIRPAMFVVKSGVLGEITIGNMVNCKSDGIADIKRRNGGSVSIRCKCYTPQCGRAGDNFLPITSADC